jgi:fatty-acyl-CoA synthase
MDGARLSYASGVSTSPLLGETIGAALERIAARYPERDALVDVAAGRRWTYAELDAAVDDLAAGLRLRGIGRGDRVGIWSPNCGEWVLTQYATAKVGAVLVNINPAFRTSELDYVIRQSGIRMIVSAQSSRGSDYRAMLSELDFHDLVFIGDPTWDSIVEEGSRARGESRDVEGDDLAFDDPINIQYTSGTTGLPKGATLSHHNILNNGKLVGEILGYSELDRICLPVPLYHCFGMVLGNLAALVHGACVVLPAPVFDPRATLAAVESERCTSLYGVPTMFIAELEHADFPDFDLTSLRTGIMAGSPCPSETMRRVIGDMHMSEVAICYGMTETSPVSLMTRRDDGLTVRTATVGRAMPHSEIKIIHPENGATVARGDIGEVCTRGYAVMLGYWDEPAKTDEAVDTARWMHTGDLGSMDAEGNVTILGRTKDVVIRGGENIYPREVEEFLHAHPDVADVQVIGVPDERYGEELMAWIIPRSGGEQVSVETIRGFCEGRLARYKIPKYVHVVERFPLTVTGKVRKVEMREMALRILPSGESPPS